jgi:hypothetical protein
MAPKQAEFYFIILFMIAASITLVAAAYVYFWLADLRKKGKVRIKQPILPRSRSLCGSIKTCALLLKGENSSH